MSEADLGARYEFWAKNLPRIWHAADNHRGRAQASCCASSVPEVVLDQPRAPGQVWLKIVSGRPAQTSQPPIAQRRVHTYRDYRDLEPSSTQRVVALNGAGKMGKEIATALNREGFVAAR